MTTEYGTGIFRVIGCLRPGFLEVKYVGDGKGPVATRRDDGGVIIRNVDEVWISEVPMDLVPRDSRFPNCLIEVSVRNRSEILDVVSVREHAP